MRQPVAVVDVPVSPTVKRDVFALVHDDKIARVVVAGDGVPVMDDLVEPNPTAEVALGDGSMLRPSPHLGSDRDVAVVVFVGIGTTGTRIGIGGSCHAVTQ